MSQQQSNVPVPLTILTGFLGAGKTTLLNRILHGDHGLRVAVLVNDFGAINIDAELVVGVDEGMVSLSNGCICCSLRDDLADAARRLLQQPQPPQYVVIEASGVSDPLAVALTFTMVPMRQLFRLDSIIAVVDAEQLPAFRDNRSYCGLVEEQIGAADIVVLNKVDLVSDEQRVEVRRWIEGRVPRARIFETSHAVVPLELLLDVGSYRLPLDSPEQRVAAHAEQHEHEHEHEDGHDHDHEHEHHHHDETFGTWSWQTDRPLDLRAVQRALKTLPPTIIRAKGVLNLADLPDSRAIVHVVGRRVTVTPGERWGATPPATRLVVIGTPGGVPAGELEQRFEQCVAGGGANGLRGALAGAWNWVRAG